MTTRRDFIRQTALATGGLVMTSSAFGGFFIGKRPKVIIIGAGFSGLAAAYYLHKKNIDFVVLESRNRVGGRVFSHTLDEPENLVVELGAEWVGASHKRLIALTEEMGLKLDNINLIPTSYTGASILEIMSGIIQQTGRKNLSNY